MKSIILIFSFISSVALSMDSNEIVLPKEYTSPLPLHFAISKKDHATIAIAIKNEEYVNVVDYNGITPLILSIQCKDIHTAILLIKNNANINYQDKLGKTPLMYAIESEDTYLINELINNRNAELDPADNRGKTALHYAIKQKSVVYKKKNNCPIQALISKGANIDACDNQKNVPPPLIFAIELEHGDVALMLLEKNVNVNLKYDGKTALEYALAQRNFNLTTYRNVVKKIIDNESLTSIITKKGYSTYLIDVIESFDYEQIIDQLIKKKVDINYITLHQTSALWHAIRRSCNDSVVNKLIEEANDEVLNTLSNKESKTPLMLACSYNQYDRVERLLNKGANPNIKNEKGSTALNFAGLRIAFLLLKRGATINQSFVVPKLFLLLLPILLVCHYKMEINGWPLLISWGSLFYLWLLFDYCPGEAH